MSNESVLAEEQRVGQVLYAGEAWGNVTVLTPPVAGPRHVCGQWYVHEEDRVLGYEVPRDFSLKVVAQ